MTKRNAALPPNYRPAENPAESCRTCAYFAPKGWCEMYEVPAEADHTCDKWTGTRSAPTEVPMPDEITEQRREYSQAARDKYAKEGVALPDGSYPIPDVAALKDAISAYGRAGDKAAAKAHIIKRAKALGRTDLIPEDWRAAEPVSSDKTEPSESGVPEGDVGAQESEDCPSCNGTGRSPEDDGPCDDCGGTGQVGGPSETLSADEGLERRERHAQEREGMVEHRAVTSFELRDTADGLVRFSGYASTTEAPYEIADFTETIARGAFKRTLGEGPDVRLVVNHGVGGQLPLARTKSGTLALSEDARGLKVDADLDPNDPDVRSLIPKMRRGDVDEMSFAFRATAQDWDDKYENRLIREVNLHRGDVSIVTTGANPDTSALIRSAEGEYELRVGKAISSSNQSALEKVLNRFESIDMEADAGQSELSAILGVENPDEDEPDRSEELKITVQPRRSLDLEAVKVRLARAKGGER